MSSNETLPPPPPEEISPPQVVVSRGESGEVRCGVFKVWYSLLASQHCTKSSYCIQNFTAGMRVSLCLLYSESTLQ